ncbi:Hypothetical predicted protein [Paramuricea clavata]|uniref:Uncharacterized protein n=1 Tax=Paramuricea clavata TaxID=317549 RepID=A0A6S7G3M1_PARCT|nr:Hypothetical predicted protein [Paramuricea clavata]
MSISATDGVQMAGFLLHNASWNETKGCLEEIKTSGNQRIPSLLLRPGERGETFSAKTTSKNQPYQFDRPVYVYDNLPGRFEPIIPLSYVTLSSSLPTHVCRQRQVF